MTASHIIVLVARWIQAHSGAIPTWKECAPCHGLPGRGTIAVHCGGLPDAIGAALQLLDATSGQLGSVLAASSLQGMSTTRMDTCLRCGRIMPWARPAIRHCVSCRQVLDDTAGMPLSQAWDDWDIENLEDIV